MTVCSPHVSEDRTPDNATLPQWFLSADGIDPIEERERRQPRRTHPPRLDGEV